ncbi:MAG: DUF6311 domain-containing protein [Ilumatobacteraceae bacterium]
MKPGTSVHRHYLVGFLGALGGAIFVGWSRINPTNTLWLRRGDLGFEQILWNFSRQESLFRWPLLAVQNYGDGWGTQLIGGNALLPLVLGPIWRVTGFPNQYIGLWLVSCIGLHAYWSSRLTACFTEDRRLVTSSSILLTLAPVLFYRIGWMSHATLACQWILLWALVLYFTRGGPRRSWLIILLVAVLSNLYIFVMTAAVYAAAAARDILIPNNTYLKRTWQSYGVVGLATIGGMWIFGVFRLGESATGDGTFRANLLAFLNPDFAIDEFSILWTRMPYFRSRTLPWESGEGFAYLGLGGIAVVLLGSFEVGRLVRAWRSWVSLVVVGIALYLVSLSNVVAVGRREVSYWWPDALLEFRQAFRAAPRFSWLLYYILLIGGIAVVVQSRRLRPLVKVVVMATIAVVQVVDISHGLATSRRELRQPGIVNSVVFGDEWETFATQDKQLVFTPTFDIAVEATDRDTSEWQDSAIWFDLVWWASERNLRTNFAATARPATLAVTRENARIRRELESGEFRTNSVYIFRSEVNRDGSVDLLRAGCESRTVSRVALVVCD